MLRVPASQLVPERCRATKTAVSNLQNSRRHEILASRTSRSVTGANFDALEPREAPPGRKSVVWTLQSRRRRKIGPSRPSRGVARAKFDRLEAPEASSGRNWPVWNLQNSRRREIMPSRTSRHSAEAKFSRLEAPGPSSSSFTSFWADDQGQRPVKLPSPAQQAGYSECPRSVGPAARPFTLTTNCRAVGPLGTSVAWSPALQAGLGKRLALWAEMISCREQDEFLPQIMYRCPPSRPILSPGRLPGALGSCDYDLPSV